MKIKNVVSPKGNTVANQFVIEEKGGIMGNFKSRDTFQSYDSIIAIRTVWDDETRVELDEKYWNYSRTTLKYLNLFLGTSSKKEIEKGIKEGIYKLTNLN